MTRLRSATFLAFIVCSALFSQESGLDLVHKLQQALGGAEALAGIQDFEQVITANTWNRDGKLLGEVRKRVRWVKPNHLRVDQLGNNFNTFVLYFDGAAGWELMPDQRVLALTGGELEFARKYLFDFTLGLWTSDKIDGYQIMSPAPHVIRISGTKAEDQLDYTLDPVTSLPVKRDSVSLADPTHPVPSEIQMSDWVRVKGVQFPRKMVIVHDGIRMGESVSLDIRTNSGLRVEDLALQPPDLRPQIVR